MRLFSIGLLTALFVPFAAYAQAPKQVEVTNLPAVQEVTGSVEVTNLPSSARVHPIGLANGVALVAGPAQARLQYNQLCKDTFGEDSFVCTAEDLSRVGEQEIIAAGLAVEQCVLLGVLPADSQGQFGAIRRFVGTGVTYGGGCPATDLPHLPLCCAEQ